ncbi:M20/M25/M40 family metallo-hydrolase [Metamycoplasma equirhinis]|uniref:M20/M25/M40 family metallo-hydrolase n=1 Tax=Metamycoplasma equirhinis TaxID=92402 RepID=A0ABZ0PAS2_9BACT|nr:M20/M25/M40 family metallo-hydrolase [Metamycoplasma equirhinis]TPD99409.1 M20 family metallopeptidase [Metamycoplasma equirhinis]WPB53847.1 M20/M25/M40 family metallo-hydrolase [Metamycoplasma equirhinis]
MKKYVKYNQNTNEFEEMIKHMANLCAIPSISIENDSKFPFGKDTDSALEYALDLSKKFGFNVFKDPLNRYGFAEIGSGEKIIGILGHLDVVPAGDESQWKTSAFVPVITENELICRGSLDDKGPVIINMYAMKYILDNNLLGDEWKIRLVFGIAEETTMQSMKYYLKDFGDPYISYTPDGEWPLIYAEKMVYHVDISFPRIKNLFIKAGDVVNQIPDSAEYEYKKAKAIVKGIGGHGSTPEKGDNAIIKTIKLLASQSKELLDEKMFKFIFENFPEENYELKHIFNDYKDFSGNLSANLGMIKTTESEHVLSFDLRVPVTHSIENVTLDLNNYLRKFGNNVYSTLINSKVPKYIDRESKLVQILMQTFNEGMNTNEKPLAIGGGTYARLIDTCVAFGSTKYMHLMHGPNEYFTFKEIKESLEIYINALIRLQDYEK